MNQNLEGSLFFVLRKKPFDKVVMDARQSGLGWVPSFDWHYTFMIQTIGGDRAPEQGREGPSQRLWRAEFDLGELEFPYPVGTKGW